MPPRLARLPTARAGGGVVRVAATRRARLLGLAGLRIPPPWGLLLPHTRSVHTFGMRFALDLVWLDERGRTIRLDAGVRPGRLRTCRRARAVIELPVARAQRRSRAVAQARGQRTPQAHARERAGPGGPALTHALRPRSR